ncbi:FAD-dependent oxidoreductase [Actinoplanes teichomyceticus]|uniref:2-polyprenyl-6-methoxyphenol hydroxylase-like FAD-dependent oxidoreductase n=1 Tax=Actinoplanes teichomyceticus TaxID=1867 RepID=A0A561VIY3_ACTTI|nr:FAD-dependent monooxygenase [Actinoplanes teichomyceticus]TWG11534.1 2-polyprenyl-6-methoxyphenol hydroxylase-like FAD-dependent oxidoreductase [Actinoplanes teichomyceticus]GIF15980.1 FAD-binding monooxygenase [Actinoplanes teichomyceticus]
MSAARRFARLSTAQPPRNPGLLLHRAIVLGGGVAGLMAARVLSDHAAQVLIVEPDDLVALDVPDERLAADPAGAAVPRPGVPQGSQVHALLAAGQIQLERWFPGFVREAVAAGAVIAPPGATRLYLDGRLRVNPPGGVAGRSLSSSRPFLEALLRHRVLRLPRVRTVPGRAEGLLTGGGAVTGVRYRPAGSAGTVDEPADFVVDATGRASRLGDWLVAAGFPRPATRRVGIRLNYATALFPRPADTAVWTCVSIAGPGPGRTARIGGFTPIEGDRWMMLVSGYAGDRPGRDPGEFRERCVRDFPAEFAAVATAAAPIGGVVTYHQADSRRRDFELDRFPARLIAAGDAVASFNPVYGQGMTAAMLHASGLSEYLRGRPDLSRPARSYFADVRVVVDAAWQVSATADLALPHVDGPYPPGYRAMRRVSRLIAEAAARDPAVNRRVGRVTAMLAHPSSLSGPGLLLRALAAAARR